MGTRQIAIRAAVSERLQQGAGLSLYNSCTLLSALYLVGVVVLLVAPETKGQELPE